MADANEMNDYDPNETLRPEFTADGHLDEGTIHTWLDGAYDEASAATVQAHVDSCAACREAVAEGRGFIAGASRITRALDAVPSDVVPASDIERAASRIVAAAMPAAMVASAPSARASFGGAAPLVPAMPPRNAWYQSSTWRAAAALFVMVGGGGVVLWRTTQRDGTPAIREVAAARRDTALAVPAAQAPVMSAPTTTNGRASDVANAPAERTKKLAAQPLTDAPTQVTAPATPLPTSPPAAAAPPLAASRAKAEAIGAVARNSVERDAVSKMTAGASPMPSSDRKIIIGHVTGADGKPLEGVSVSIVGTALGMMTDQDGRFSLRTSSDSATVVTRRLGYNSVRQSIALRDGDTVRADFKLNPSLQQLSEVVVAQSRPRPERALNAPAQRASAKCERYLVQSADSAVRVRFSVNEAFSREATYNATLDNWPTIGMQQVLSLTLDARGTLSGSTRTTNAELTLSLTRRDLEWVGRATQDVGDSRVERDVRMTATGVCKP